MYTSKGTAEGERKGWIRCFDRERRGERNRYCRRIRKRGSKWKWKVCRLSTGEKEG